MTSELEAMLQALYEHIAPFTQGEIDSGPANINILQANQNDPTDLNAILAALYEHVSPFTPAEISGAPSQIDALQAN